LEDSSVRVRQWLGHFLFLVSLCGCVSVSLSKGESRRSQSYTFKEPSKPFVSHTATQVDHAWKNPNSGSIVSVVSECSETADPELITLRNDIVGSLSYSKVETEQRLKYQAREALRSLVRGQVDGVESFIDILVFKKNGCSYILSLVTGPRELAVDQPHFEKFLSGFEAP
jgi:hypothetical protein